MLTIRNKQMEAFRRVSLYSFEDEMNIHLAKFSPPLYKAAKEEQIRKVIQLGIIRANKYGFNFRGPVRLYLEMMILLGSYFDTDPQYPWAAEILKTNEGTQMERAYKLYYQICDYRKQVNGKDDEYTLDAFKAIASYAKEPLTLSNSDFVLSMQQDIALIYPQKNDYIGINPQKKLINESLVAAQKYAISTDRGNALSVVLMLAFGHGCFVDSLYPWINGTVNDDSIIGSHAKVKGLESKAIIWIDHILNNYKEIKDGTT